MARNQYFQFKQFRVVQERSAMKVGMDGVLIGAWADVSGANYILDVGTGTGLIALMMAQRSPLASIEAIEIDQQAFEESLLNVRQSPWNNRIQIACLTFQELANRSEKKYDLIISNPPYFSNGVKAPDHLRCRARHDDELPLKELISGIALLLSPWGRAAFILPVESLSELKNSLQSNGLALSRICYVKPNPQKPVFRVMVEITRNECSLKEEHLLIEHEQHFDYTTEYRELTRDFYLKFE